MREQGIPEDWLTGKATNIKGDANQFPSHPPGNLGSHHPEDESLISGQVPRKSLDLAALTQVNLGWTQQTIRSNQHQPVPEDRVLAGKSTSIAPTKVESSQTTAPPLWLRWSKNWLFWAVLASLVSGSIGFVSVALLLKLPSAPNCPAIFWPLASASVRLHCAQVAANKQTVDDLLQAIALVEALPQDHPLRGDINSSIEQWSRDILSLADEQFQSGQLEEAIAIAQKIPPDTAAKKVVEPQIQQWQSIWAQGEKIYQQAEAEIRQQHWRLAFMETVRLLNLENNYWATTKYEELNRLIETTRDDAGKLAKVDSLVKKGDTESLLTAVRLAESIGASSFLHQDAQKLIPEIGRKMLDAAQAALDRQDAQAALDIANKIPASTGLEADVQDFIVLAEAWRSAWVGTVPSLENAILVAQKLGPDRPRYNEAQELVTRWQLEIEDVVHLDRARELALGGTIDDLKAAIAEAELVPTTNPRAEEAGQEINSWRRRVETVEDQPFLDRAEELAIPEDIISLQAAIAEAERIGRGRALYSEARRKIRNWTRKIEQIQDQPYLDQARTLASNGNLPAAIAAAQQIGPGRALSGEAQAAVSDWQGQLRARENWREAQQVVLQGTPDALAEAIRLAQQVPNTSPLRMIVDPAIARWSQQLLRIAQERGLYDMPAAIEIARRIPRNTDVYQAAQAQIATWEQFLNPPPPQAPPTPSPAAAPNLEPANANTEPNNPVPAPD